MLSLVSEVPVPLNTLSSWSRGALQGYLHQDAVTAASAREIWNSLIGSLATSTLSEKQITSTCNCLRIFLKTTLSVGDREVKELPLSRAEWMSCYAAICETWSRAKVKPLLQVLEVLLQVARNGMPADQLDSIWTSISSELSSIIISAQPTRDLKRALALTSFFLEKRLSIQIYYQSVRRNAKHWNEDVTGDIANDPRDQHVLFEAVLISFLQHDAQSSAEKCFRTLLKANVEYAPDTQSAWKLLESFGADHPGSLDAIANSIFPVLLEREPRGHLGLIQSQSAPENEHELLFYLALLKSLREREMMSQSELHEHLQKKMLGRGPCTSDAVALLLSHADDEVRVRTLRLLPASMMTNATISLQILQSLESSIPLWFRPGGAHERGEVLSTIRRLLIRLRGGASTLGNNTLLEAHKSFIQMLIAHVSDNIFPNASYQQRIMGLSIFKYLLDSKVDYCDRSPAKQKLPSRPIGVEPTLKTQNMVGRSNDPDWPFSICLRQISNVQSLLKLASDAYEDIRALSTSILKHLLLAESDTSHSGWFSEQIQTTFTFLVPRLEAEAAQTNRSDHADGLGRIYALQDLAQKRKRSSADLSTVQDKSVLLDLVRRLEQVLKDKSTFHSPDPQPLHSLLLGVMYCLMESSIHSIQDRVIRICHQVWDAVADRLCIDSPETTEEEIGDFEEAVTGPKDMLSYSWRALRDCSLLLRSLLIAPRGLETDQFLLAIDAIGRLCMDQLTRLRHRGAFSTVAQTFMLCCQQLTNIYGPELLGLRYEWYQNAEAEIEKQADRLTRRSAGLPAMMAGILSPEDCSSFGIFMDSFITRSQIATVNENAEAFRISLPQVHAMNSLREVMINSRFREAVVPHLQKLLILAATNLGSQIWAIQNCGLMLYRACLMRLSNEDLHRPLHTGATNMEKLSAPIVLALKLLHERSTPEAAEIFGSIQDGSQNRERRISNELVRVEQKFAALDMIARMLPLAQSKHDIREHLFVLLKNPIWLVRERAAGVLALLIPIDELGSEIRQSFETTKVDIGQNMMHGTLLYSSKLLQRWVSTTSKQAPVALLNEVLQEFLLMTTRVGKHQLAPPIWAAIFEIENSVIEHSLSIDTSLTGPLLDCEDFCAQQNIRRYCLAETALLYNIALKLVISHKLGSAKNNDFSSLLLSMKKDPDAARNVLERLLSQNLVFHAEELVQLYQNLPTKTHPHAVPIVLDMISLSLETSGSEWDAEKAIQVLNVLDQPVLTRGIGASKLVAQAKLLSVIALPEDDEQGSCATVSRHRTQFETDVQHAARDKMDTHVRLQAAKALSAYLPCLLGANFDGLMLLFTLRNLLNDDDEEIRSSGARTVSAFASRDSKHLHLGVIGKGVCAPAALSQLEEILGFMVHMHPTQPEVLLSKLLDVDYDICIKDFLRRDTVEHQLHIFLEESRALFAVERQNLYIDELHEIHFWSSMCRANARESQSPLDSKIELALGRWLVEGLRILYGILDGVEEIPMLPNITFDLDILLLCIRVVSVAGEYLFFPKSQERHSGVNVLRQSIQDHLRDLKSLASSRHFNPELTRSINAIWERL